ncbi:MULTISPECIES: sulfatase-like hydrolase/transferase [unclassified Leeuwenhoekiella]|uniref:sulfatase-like hydrolase/transferase n=1 Tax=unclassified Leeuwenhoekiella TaxID=2615029 RepID=UPI000C45F1F8|nr:MULTISPECIES: sulfatase-like hydrolase/transferase [unclassified Leeuwenhoekiella]MAW93870.1 sulfatase [Leeuwenhoekiella sp.]MBA82277.1 sulfatase [Leeuwenhoekiella sp.]|tara:strand:- start:1563 stop:3650 length:2088 start_codon:yes stop_codon:yes gene_type:complete
MKYVPNLYFLVLVILFSQTIYGQPKAEKPNILFILVDDLGYGDVGVFFQNERRKRGDDSEPWMATPHLDQMAYEGAMLTNHYVPAPVCAPSRASLLSGLSQGHANVRDNQFDKALANNHTLGSVLRQAGYATALIGKYGLQGSAKWSENGDAWPAQPLRRGFDYFYGYMRHGDGHEHYPNEGIYRGPKTVYENTTAIKTGLDKSYTTDLWTARAKKWITEQVKEDDKPFFMFLSYDTPHAVLELPTQKYPEGGGLEGGLQWLGKAGKMINTASGTPDSYMHPDYKSATYDNDKNKDTPEVAWPETYKRYATSVRRIDDAVGDIFKLLEDLNIDENTLVVFASDNGPSKESYLPKGYVENTPDFFNSFGPFDGIKRDVLEGGLRTPLIVRWPAKVARNRVVESPSIFYDWLPTFTEAAGLIPPANTDGTSLIPALTGLGKQQESIVYVEYFQGGITPGYKEFAKKNQNRQRGQMQMIRKGSYVGLRYDIQSADDDFEIYNISKDKQEEYNLAEVETLRELQQLMKDEVLQLRMPDTSAIRPYDDTPIPSVKDLDVSKGYTLKQFEGLFPWLPKLDLMRPVSERKLTDVNEMRNLEDGLYLIEAFIQVPEDGIYVFKFTAKDKGLVRLHNALLYDADYKYKTNKTLEKSVHLKKGLHPIKIYFTKCKGAGVPYEFKWTNGNIRKEDYNNNILYNKRI